MATFNPLKTMMAALTGYSKGIPAETGETAEEKKKSGLPIGEEEIHKAVSILQKYKDGKTKLEQVIIENEKWYRLQHWDLVPGTTNKGKRTANDDRPRPTSAWLLNALANKHADAMDNYPEPNVLPREQQDETDADTLSSIIPVVLERNDFEQTYSNAWWYKLKHGCVPYGVFWDSSLEKGLGDIKITQLELLNLFWEPGITDIQDSRNVFYCSLVDTDTLDERYPEYKGKFGSQMITVADYIYDDTIDKTNKSVVVDWYYKKAGENGHPILHYCKFCGDVVLFSTENNPQQYPNGWYEHGQYPFVFDVLFPEAGTPVGFGYLQIMKDPQMYIDKLSQSILENTIMAAKPRFFVSEGCGINEEEFLNWSNPFVHYQGNMDKDTALPIVTAPLPAQIMNVQQSKIDELKETAGNRDFSQGSTSGGVTAASAIAALQEAGNKLSRDMISASYRAYTKINYMIIELIREFYDETRYFRIVNSEGMYKYIQFNNQQIKGTPMQPAYEGQPIDPTAMRVPIFDIVIKPQKRSAYSRLAQNEMAKELYAMGFFDPERATPSLIALDMMEFDGDEKIKQKVQEGQTLQNIIEQLSMELARKDGIIAGLTGVAPPSIGGAVPSSPSPRPQGGGKTMAKDQKNAQKATMSPYSEKIASRATPKMDGDR